MTQELTMLESPDAKAVIRLEAAKKELREAKDLAKVKKVRDQAEAIRNYIKTQKGSLQLQNDAAELKLIAERRAGEILKETGLDKGGRPSKFEQLKAKNRSHDATGFPKLDDLGITKSESSRWQKEAEIPEEVFREYVKEKREKNEEITQRDLLRKARAISPPKKAQRPKLEKAKKEIIPPPPEVPKQKYKTIVINTPEGVSGKELLKIRVKDWAQDDCHLYFRVENEFLKQAMAVLDFWGFEYKTVITWMRTRSEAGDYFRNSTEQILFAVRGELDTKDNSVPSHFEAPPGRDLPEELVALIEKASGGPFLSIFSEKLDRKEWTALDVKSEAQAEVGG